jgi:hypothetical protein
MPTGPKGQMRPTDVIGAAVMVAKIATDEIQDIKNTRGRKMRSWQAGVAYFEAFASQQRTVIEKKPNIAWWQ